MSKRRVNLISVFFATVASLGLYSQTNAQLETPEDVVRATAESILQSMADRKDYLAAHPAELYRLVDSIFLPRFDRNYA
ncbi:MAG: hypothetical protein O6930_07360, partial [Gammaproteobacteria bacterium]|nr:hypothetical protein [Gammaproteobacteria bacterium]